MTQTGVQGADFVWLTSICSPDLETHLETLLKNVTDAFAVCACGGRTHECAISQLGAWVKRQRARRATLELAQIPANNPLPLPSTTPTNSQDPQGPRAGSIPGAESGLTGLHPSHYHHPEPTLPIHPAHIGAVAAVMGSAGFGVATGGDVSEEEDENLGMVPGPGALPRRSFARKAGQVVGEAQEGVVRGLWEKEGGYVFPRPQLGRQGDGFVVRVGEETESDGDRPRARTIPRHAGTLQAPIELDQEQVTMPLPGETPADALRRIKGIDLGVLVGGSRGVKVLKPEHGGMHGVRIDERWGHVRSGDVRNRGQVQRRSSIVTVGADVDEALLGREKRKRVDEEEGPVRKRARKDVEMAIIEQIEEVRGERGETYMPPRARKGWKSFRQRFEQRGVCLPCLVVKSATEYTFVVQFHSVLRLAAHPNAWSSTVRFPSSSSHNRTTSPNHRPSHFNSSSWSPRNCRRSSRVPLNHIHDHIPNDRRLHRCHHRHILTIPLVNPLKRPRRVRRSSPRPFIHPAHRENNRRGIINIRFRAPTSRTLTRTSRNLFTLRPITCRVLSLHRRYCRWMTRNYRHHRSPGRSRGYRKFSNTLSLCTGEVGRYHRFRFQGQQLR